MNNKVYCKLCKRDVTLPEGALSCFDTNLVKTDATCKAIYDRKIQRENKKRNGNVISEVLTKDNPIL